MWQGTLTAVKKKTYLPVDTMLTYQKIWIAKFFSYFSFLTRAVTPLHMPVSINWRGIRNCVDSSSVSPWMANTKSTCDLSKDEYNGVPPNHT